MGVSENSHHGAECSGNDGEGDVSPELVAEDGDNDETDVEGSDNDGDGDFPPELVADDGDSDVSELEGSDNGLDGDPPPPKWLGLQQTRKFNPLLIIGILFHTTLTPPLLKSSALHCAYFYCARFSITALIL
jgi:hypothetical protein